VIFPACSTRTPHAAPRILTACATLEKTSLDRGRTDRISLTYDRDLQSPASYRHDLLARKRSGSTVSRFRIEWKQINVRIRTDRRTDRGGDYITALMQSVNREEPADAKPMWSQFKHVEVITDDRKLLSTYP